MENPENSPVADDLCASTFRIYPLMRRQLPTENAQFLPGSPRQLAAPGRPLNSEHNRSRCSRLPPLVPRSEILLPAHVLNSEPFAAGFLPPSFLTTVSYPTVGFSNPLNSIIAAGTFLPGRTKSYESACFTVAAHPRFAPWQPNQKSGQRRNFSQGTYDKGRRLRQRIFLLNCSNIFECDCLDRV